MEREREVEEIWRWLRGSKIKKKLMLPNKEMVVKEKSEKYQSDFRKWDQNEKMKQYHYLQKGIKKISSSNPPPFWGQNRFLMPALCPLHPQPGSHCSASLPAWHNHALSQALGWAKEHLSPAQTLLCEPSNYQLTTSHALSSTFSHL